jgi:hypothetical protein
MMNLVDKKFRGIVEELTDYVPQRDRDVFIESRAQQVIASALHLIRLINETYSAELADDLTKRLLSSIRNEDEEKFRRKVRQIRENRRKKIKL